MSHSFTAVTIFFNEHLRLHPPMRLQISPAQLAMDVVLQEKFNAHDIYEKNVLTRYLWSSVLIS